MAIRAAKAKLTVVEVPSFELGRIHGRSNLNAFGDGWRILKLIVRERLSRGRVPQPTLSDDLKARAIAAREATAPQVGHEPVESITAAGE
jgi:hypothetical protein